MSASSRSEQTLADFVAAAIAPVLIMALIGSLVFFVVEVLYIGEYYGRLLWILFCFIFGSVLVARIAMRGDIGNRAGMYGLVLGLLMWLALTIYVEFPRGVTWAADLGWAIHLALIFLIWWSAQRLTWDSTLQEDKADANDKGLLDAAGLDRPGPAVESVPDPEEERKRKKEKRRLRKTHGLAGWWERYRHYRAEKKERPRTHGVWVVYFSLAALPLFGLGQALIPVGDAGRRQYAFWLMCIYVASGLGLLLTTTFLGLRRYLRQKKLQMPAAVTTTWLFFGTTLIIGLLVVGALMPRPHPEYSLAKQFLQFGSPKHDASEAALEGKEPVGGEGTSTNANGQKPDKTGNQGQGNQTSGQKSGADAHSTPGKTGGKPASASGNGKDQPQQGANQAGSQKQTGGSGPKSPQDNNNAKGQPQPNDPNPKSDQGKQPAAPATPKSWLNDSSFSWLKPLGDILKWVVLGVVIVLVVFFVLRALLSFLANFTLWAKDLSVWLAAWWQGMWARDKSARPQLARTDVKKENHRPFSQFRDPFQSGAFRQMSAVEVIRYSFAALEAWARERHLSRPTGETPLEFTERVAEEYPALDADAHRLADYYAAAAYAPDQLDTNCFDDLRQFWHMLRDVAQNPLSAGTLT